MVQHTAGRAHHQLGPVTQGVHLLFVAHAAIDGHGTDARAFEQGARLVLHLHGQLAGGHQDQGLGGVQLGPSDLALGLGIKETYNFDNPQVKSRFELLYKKAKEKGIPLMGPIAPPNLERAIEMAENGVRVMTLRNDVTNFKMLLAGLRKDVYIPLKKHFETV